MELNNVLTDDTPPTESEFIFLTSCLRNFNNIYILIKYICNFIRKPNIYTGLLQTIQESCNHTEILQSPRACLEWSTLATEDKSRWKTPSSRRYTRKLVTVKVNDVI